MHASIVIAFLLATLCHQNETLACPECVREDQCKDDLSKCLHGVVKDACNCCDICGKGLGEECGGLWNRYGTCGKGLTCHAITGRGYQEAGACSRRPLPKIIFNFNI